jgi:hypothetical protein
MENVKDQQLSPEELAAKKDEMLKYYKDSVPYLKAQLEYEKLLADLDEVRVKRVRMQHEFAYLTQIPEEVQEENEDSLSKSQPKPKTKERKLKTN